MTEWIGALAALCTTIAFIPQMLHTMRTRDTRSISLPMYLVFTFGIVLWLIYGILIMKWPIIIANIVTLGLSGTILTMKLRYG